MLALSSKVSAQVSPGRLRRFLPHLRAGACAAVLLLWLGGVTGTLIEKGALRAGDVRPHLALLGMLAFTVSLGFGLGFGYRERAPSWSDFLQRALLLTSSGSVLFFLLLLPITGILQQGGTRDWCGPAGAVVLLALAGSVHGFRPAASGRRWARAATVGAMTLVATWPFVPSLRCAVGTAEGCRQVGLALHGAGNDVRAVEALTRACERGDLEGCVLLASYVDFGLGGPRDSARAKALVQKACADPEFCAELSDELPLSLDDLRVEAVLTYGRRAPIAAGCSDYAVIHDCFARDGKACLAIAEAHRGSCGYFDGREATLQRVRDLYAHSCSLGSATACTELAHIAADDNELREGCTHSSIGYCSALAGIAAP